MLTALAVILISIWLIVYSQGPVSTTLTLIVGVIAGILALVDLVRGAGIRLP